MPYERVVHNLEHGNYNLTNQVKATELRDRLENMALFEGYEADWPCDDIQENRVVLTDLGRTHSMIGAI